MNSFWNQFLKKLIVILKNKFVFTAIVFVVWVSFFDKNNLLIQGELKKELKELEADKKYYFEQIKHDSTALYELLNNPAAQEKIAREKYLMKKDSEEIFLIVRKPIEMDNKK